MGAGGDSQPPLASRPPTKTPSLNLGVIMARKRPQYRRPPPRPAPVRFQGPSDESLDFAASRLAQGATVEDLRMLVRQRQELRDNEDRIANQQPGPEALGRF